MIASAESSCNQIGAGLREQLLWNATSLKFSAIVSIGREKFVPARGYDAFSPANAGYILKPSI